MTSSLASLAIVHGWVLMLDRQQSRLSAHLSQEKLVGVHPKILTPDLQQWRRVGSLDLRALYGHPLGVKNIHTSMTPNLYEVRHAPCYNLTNASNPKWVRPYIATLIDLKKGEPEHGAGLRHGKLTKGQPTESVFRELSMRLAVAVAQGDRRPSIGLVYERLEAVKKKIREVSPRLWLLEVGVMFLRMRMSRGERRELSLGVRIRAHTQAALQAQLEAQAQKRADVWWSSLLRTRFEDGAVEVAWDEFVRLFRAKFILEHIQDKMEQKFLSLTPGSMTVLEYEARFAELSKYSPHIVADERRKAKKFVMSLRPSLRTRLVAFDHRTLDEALSVACRQEGEMKQYLEEKKASQKRPAAPFQR
ncbi:hypothetical protein Taro_020002 [Colocasia esculenta]|uniref:Retrotransposon gag domain-containing protein n=1 Tax=Colocasia esculenta TaxID=4460 RepID=A0A843V3Y0_COLES|nr:hypothetical protein [Colocasia esculenta]